MLLERLLILLLVFVKLYIAVQTGLLPETRNWPSYLQMRKTVSSDNNNLLCFTKISNISFDVDTSWIVSRASLCPTPPCDQRVVHHCPSLKGYLEISNRTLNHTHKPSSISQFLYILCNIFIPKEFFLGRHAQRMRTPRQTEIIPKGKIVPLNQQVSPEIGKVINNFRVLLRSLKTALREISLSISFEGLIIIERDDSDLLDLEHRRLI